MIHAINKYIKLTQSLEVYCLSGQGTTEDGYTGNYTSGNVLLIWNTDVK
jgi:hypothetical protein